jgi:hypothetical protein
LVIWPYPGGEQRVVLELKLKHQSLEQTIQQGLEQTWAYMDQTGTKAGHLVIFDRKAGRSWEAKIFNRMEEFRGVKIKIWGM